MFTSGTLECEQARNGAMPARLWGLAPSAPLVAFSPGTPSQLAQGLRRHPVSRHHKLKDVIGEQLFESRFLVFAKGAAGTSEGHSSTTPPLRSSSRKKKPAGKRRV
jgi:hypothetical protein